MFAHDIDVGSKIAQVYKTGIISTIVDYQTKDMGIMSDFNFGAIMIGAILGVVVMDGISSERADEALPVACDKADADPIPDAKGVLFCHPGCEAEWREYRKWLKTGREEEALQQLECFDVIKMSNGFYYIKR